MSAASVRISLWRQKKPPFQMTRLVSVESVTEAVFVAQQWIIWSHNIDRGKLPKYDWYRVETRAANGVWNTVCEGTLGDAKTQQPKEAQEIRTGTTTSKRLIGDQGPTGLRKGSGRTKRERPQSRLAQIVARVKAQQ